MRLLPTCASVTEKYVHSNSAEYENSGYGTPSLGIPASRPKKKVNVTMVNSGWRRPRRHPAPPACSAPSHHATPGSRESPGSARFQRTIRPLHIHLNFMLCQNPYPGEAPTGSRQDVKGAPRSLTLILS